MALRRSQENLARAQRIAAIGSFDRDLLTGRGEWSEEFLKIWGITNRPPEDATQEPLASLVHPDDREKFLAGREAAIRNETLMPVDFRITRPDGVERVLHREYGALYDDKGKAIRLFGTVQDITESKAIETELRRSREDLARAQRVAGIGSFSRDIATGRTEWSEEFLRVWGIERDGKPSNRRNAGGDGPSRRSQGVPAGPRPRPDQRGRQRARFPHHAARRRRAHPASRIRRAVRRERQGRAHVRHDPGHHRAQASNELELRRSRENMARAQHLASIGSFERDLLTDTWEWSDEMYRILGAEIGIPAAGRSCLRWSIPTIASGS